MRVRAAGNDFRIAALTVSVQSVLVRQELASGAWGRRPSGEVPSLCHPRVNARSRYNAEPVRTDVRPFAKRDRQVERWRSMQTVQEPRSGV